MRSRAVLPAHKPLHPSRANPGRVPDSSVAAMLSLKSEQTVAARSCTTVGTMLPLTQCESNLWPVADDDVVPDEDGLDAAHDDEAHGDAHTDVVLVLDAGTHPKLPTQKGERLLRPSAKLSKENG